MPEPRELLSEYVYDMILQLTRRTDVPDVVVDSVFAIKQLADRVDGRIHCNTVCLVLMGQGFSAKDNLYGFEREKGMASNVGGDKEPEKTPEPVVDLAAPPKVDPTEGVVGDSAVDEAKVKDAEPPVEKEDTEVTPAPVEDIDAGPQPLAKETVVTFIHEGNYVDGKIVSSQIADEDIFYNVEVDGIEDEITVHEDDVELKK